MKHTIIEHEKEKWLCRDRVLYSKTLPHEDAEVSFLKKGSIWKKGHVGERAFVARFTSCFDCGEETDWWYCIKDTPYDINAINAKKRYEIIKARRNFRVEKVDPTAYIDEMYAVLEAAHAAYPAKYRPQTTYESFSKEYIHQGGVEWVVAFCNNEQDASYGKICGYTVTKRQETVVSLVEQKSIPEMQKKGLNAALIDFILLENYPLIFEGGYIIDGERSIFHQTNFQNYLEKYFGFRKAYCRLHIFPRPGYGICLKMLYPFRSLFQKLDHIGLIHKLNALFVMQDYAKSTARLKATQKEILCKN